MAVSESVTSDELGDGEATTTIDRKVAFGTKINAVGQAQLSEVPESGWHYLVTDTPMAISLKRVRLSRMIRVGPVERN